MSSNHRPQSLSRVYRRPSYRPPTSQDWWQVSRRQFIVGGTALAGVVALGGVSALLVSCGSHDDSKDITKDSVELQKSHGWNVGSEDKTLVFPNKQTLDSQNSEAWKGYLDRTKLLAAFTPKQTPWLSYFVPTLIQSLQFDTLRSQLAPTFTTDMQESYGRAQSIAKDFLTNAQNAHKIAIIVDIPGRNSIAFGAGLAETGVLIADFDNFPHPLGVTPSHETLAAMLYYAQEIETKQGQLKGNAPPVFLLDANRLAEYKDEEKQFDNRYVAKLPPPGAMREAGIQSILYITASRAQKEELDDLNSLFVSYKEQGLTIAILALSDFTTAPGENLAQQSTTGSSYPYHHYYYGGSPATHVFFFSHYPLYTPSAGYVSSYPSYSNPTRYSSGYAPPPPPPSYAPAPRPTVFSAARAGGQSSGVGLSKPSGFGKTTVRVSSGGSVLGTRSGSSGYYSSSRSGSFGRTSGGSSSSGIGG